MGILRRQKGLDRRKYTVRNTQAKKMNWKYLEDRDTVLVNLQTSE